MRAVIAWFTPATFAAVKRIGARDLQASYDQWLDSAETLIAQQAANGVTVEKVFIDPVRLAAWCRARGRKIDAKARAKFAVLQDIDDQRDTGVGSH